MEDRDVIIILILALCVGFVMGLMIGRDVARFNTERLACDQVAILTDLNTLYEGDTCNLKVNGMWIELESYVKYLEGED